jgi:hypothetical protein
MVTPDSNGILSSEAALCNLKRYQFVIPPVQAAFGRVVSLDIGKHLRIVHQRLKVFYRDNGEFLSLARNSFDTHRYIPPRAPTSNISITRRSSCNS